MIPRPFKLCALAASLAGLAAPALAEPPAGGARADARPSVSADGSSGPAHSRRVDLPFLLEPGTSDRQPRAPAPKGKAAPHPFRDDLPNRASRGEGAAFA